MSREEAYQKAGFEGNPKRVAGVIARKPLIVKRIDELLANSASRAELSRAKILERIYDDWEMSRKLGQMTAALKAGDMLGRELHAMFVERKEIGGPGDFASKSEDELRKILEEGLKELGWDNISPIQIPKAIN